MESRLRLLCAAPFEACKHNQGVFWQAKDKWSLTMATKAQFRLKGKSRDSYMELVLDLPLALIVSDRHLAEAQRVIDGLLSRGKLDEGEQTYLDTLSDLVGSYEDERHAIEPASDADMLRHLMEARGVSQIQLSRDTALPKSTISEVLAGKKPFSRQMIRILAKYFHVDVGVLAANI
jgi:HTH-type transcriptional regulator / antitoxin HigA